MTFTFKNFRNYAIVALSALALASCSNDDFANDAPSLKSEGMATAPQGILPGVQPANGPWVTSSISKLFRGYYKSHGNSLPNSFALNQGNFQTEYSPGGRAFNGYYYTLNNTSTGKRGIRKLKATGSNLSDVGMIITSNGRIRGQKDEVNFTLFDATHGYYTDGEKGNNHYGEISEFNPKTMQTTRTFNVKAGVDAKLKEILSSTDYELKYDGPNPDNSNEFDDVKYKKIGTKLLIRRGNYLYADVTFGNGRNDLNQIEQTINRVYVAVINVASSTPTVEKILVSDQETTNIGLFNDHPLVTIDPITNAIYFVTVADMAKTYGSANAGKFSKIVKIADSGNAIPSSMNVVTSYAQAKGNNGDEGEFNTLYVYDNVIYTKLANTSVRYGTLTIHGQNYRRDIWKYVTISATEGVKEIKYEDNGISYNLMDNFYAYQQPQLINGEIYMISNTSAGSKVYKVVPGSQGATLVTTGIAGGFGWGWASQDKISSIVKL